MTIILCVLISVNVYLYIQTKEKQKELINGQIEVQKSIEEIHRSVEELQNAHLAVQSKLHSLDLIYNTAKKYGVAPELALAVMKVESNFDPNAVNRHSQGLMQVDKRYHDLDLFNIKNNVECSFSLLSQLEKESNSLEEVLGKYNRGVTGYRRYVDRTGETVTTYSKKVMSVLDTLNK